MNHIQRVLGVVAVLIASTLLVPATAGASPAAAPNRLIVERAQQQAKVGNYAGNTFNIAAKGAVSSILTGKVKLMAPAAWEVADSKYSKPLARTGWGIATCGIITCTFTWDRNMTNFWNMLYGGDYSGTKAAAAGVVVGLACVPFTGPLAVVCGGVAAIGFSYIQETLAKAVRDDQCVSIKFFKWGPAMSAYRLETLPVSHPECMRDA